MPTKQLTEQDIQEFRAYWKSLKKDILVDKLEEMLVYVTVQAMQIEQLEENLRANNANYLSRCRGSGGVTLPPGV